jgi:3'-phosphoadenosine 5'-phosphosulfate sulfotransferase (PAPS reductase)/FAD synthetase
MVHSVKFISFGAGQCSSVLPFILSDYDYIIFADTGFELELTYAWVKLVQKSFPNKFIWIKTNLDNTINNLHPPLCTKDFKIRPIRRKLREMGVKRAVKYLGFTIDEINRQKKNQVQWIKNRFPLIEIGWSRKDCQNFLLNNFGFIPPRSGCTCCPHFDRDYLLDCSTVFKAKNNRRFGLLGKIIK